MSIPSSASIALGTAATVEFWMRPLSDGTEQRIIELGDGLGCDSSRAFDIGLNPQWMSGSGNLTPWWFFAPGCTELHKSAVWALGEWTHVAAVIDTVAGTQRLFINGQLSLEGPLPPEYVARALGSTGSPLSLGGSAAFSLRFTGELDEVRIWSTARTATQIMQSLDGADAASPGLLAYYRLEEGAGDQVADATGHGNNGTISGNVAWVATPSHSCIDPRSSGRSVALDGTSGFVSIPDAPAIDFDQSMTMEAWINMDRLSGNPQVAPRPLSKGDGANWNTDRSYEFSISPTGMPTAAFFGGTLDTYIELDPFGTTLQTGRWYHLAATFDGVAGVARLFVDGEKVVERTVSEGGTPFAGMHLTNSSRPLEIGTTSAVYWTPTPYFPGRIDEVRLWNIARTPEQIAASFACEMPGATPGLVARYAFNTDGGGAVHNAVGGGLDGAFVGGASLADNTPVCAPDVGTQGGFTGHDGVLDNNDFVAFISLFFGREPAADRGSVGAVPTPDGAWDNNDFIVYIDQFFTGC